MLASFSTETVVGWKMTRYAHLLAHISLEMRWKKTFVYCFHGQSNCNGRAPADLVNVYARHSYVAFVLSNSCKHYAPLFNFRPPAVNLLNKDLSFHTTVCPERAAQIASVLVSLGLRHRPWKFVVFFGVTGPESTFSSDTVSLHVISAEE